MRKIIFCFVLFLSGFSSFSQFRLGIFGGISNYQGDMVDKLYKNSGLALGLTGGVLAGDEADERADGVAGEPVPVADLDRKGEPGQGAHSAQASQSSHQWGELGVGGHLADRVVEPVPASLDRQDVVVVGVERQTGRTALELRQRFVAQPDVVLPGPRITVVVDDPVTQQQLRQPVPGPHQITTAVLASTDQVASRLLIGRGDRYCGDLVESQQPGQMNRVLGVGLHPISRRLLQL